MNATGSVVIASSVTVVVGKSTVVVSRMGFFVTLTKPLLRRALSSNVLVSFGTEAIGNAAVAVGRRNRRVVLTKVDAVGVGLVVEIVGVVVRTTVDVLLGTAVVLIKGVVAAVFCTILLESELRRFPVADDAPKSFESTSFTGSAPIWRFKS